MTKGKDRENIRVLVVDDHAMFREGLCQLLAAEDDITVVGEARTGAECLGLVGKLKPDIVLLDLKMPDRNGLEVLSDLTRADAPAQVIILTASEDESDYVEAVRRGARGIVPKAAATERLLEGIRKVSQGETWIDQRVAAEVMKAITETPGPRRGDKALLTPREHEIVLLVAQGFRNKEIADRLSISEQTVKNHLHNIFDKLGVSDRLELALYALHHKLAKAV
ncbi:MAG: response regulator transcription factor [Acidobacteria bacterium]|nr:response regulator transcription factor [Acidobacteriota bacterium]